MEHLSLSMEALWREPGRRAPFLGTLKAMCMSRKALEMEQLSLERLHEENLEEGLLYLAL